MKRFALLMTLALVFRLGFPVSVLADPAGQDKAVDVSGNWALTVETSAGTGSPTVELKQDGETLTGNYSSQVFGEQKVTGTIKGNAITFGLKGSFQGNEVTVTYTGTVDGSAMKGKVALSGLGEGTFTGKKS